MMKFISGVMWEVRCVKVPNVRCAKNPESTDGPSESASAGYCRVYESFSVQHFLFGLETAKLTCEVESLCQNYFAHQNEFNSLAI